MGAMNQRAAFDVAVRPKSSFADTELVRSVRGFHPLLLGLSFCHEVEVPNLVMDLVEGVLEGNQAIGD